MLHVKCITELIPHFHSGTIPVASFVKPDPTPLSETFTAQSAVSCEAADAQQGPIGWIQPAGIPFTPPLMTASEPALSTGSCTSQQAPSGIVNLSKSLVHLPSDQMLATADTVAFPAGQILTKASGSTSTKLPATFVPTTFVPRRRIYKVRRENRSNLHELLRIQRATPDKLCSVNAKGETKAHLAVRSGDIAAVDFLLKVVPSMFMIKDQNEMVPSQLATPRRNGLVSCFQ